MATRAFDDRRPPALDLLEACVHCGFCLPTCPTYALWGEEPDSPRGRIVLMRAGLEPGSELSAAMVEHFDSCLGCMACVSSCPSGVRYDELIEATRAQVERNAPRPAGERLLRAALFAVLPRPDRLRRAAPALRALDALGVPGLTRRRRGGLLGRFPRLRGLAQLAPGSTSTGELPELTPAQGAPRGRVGLLQGCVQRVFFGEVNAATAHVLAAEGFDVVAPRDPRCCGALQLHAGAEAAAVECAKATIAAFADCELVVVNAAGCGSAMKGYGRLLADDPAWAARAEAFAARVRDVHELLAADEPRAPRHPLALRAAYHDACHLAHAQGIRAEPRALLRGVPGLELLEPDEWELCCGSAGIWGLLEPEPAAELGRRKARALLATGAEAIVAANPGCALQLAAQLGALGRPLPVLHPMELLSRSLAGHAP